MKVEFTADDVMALLVELCGDRALAADRVCDWLDEHVHNIRAAHVLLHVAADVTAELGKLKANESQTVGIEIDEGAPEPEPGVLPAMQLVAAAGNDDTEMLTALILPIVKAGPEVFTDVLFHLLTMFRAVYDYRAAEAS
jgi:hypothetical protein